LSDQPRPSDQIGFLFTDIEGSSVKWLGYTAEMQGALAQHDRLMREAIEACGGEVFKTAGDAFYAAFPRADQALNAAIAAQRALGGWDFSRVDGLRVRMGVHFGVAQKRGDDYFGPALNRCARLLVLGHGGQILATPELLEAVRPEAKLAQALRPIGANPLDDPEQDVAIYQVVLDGLQQSFPALRNPNVVSNNLPHAASALIGREHELESAQSLLAAQRWVTLTGPGGVGKTRLALEIGSVVVNAGQGTEAAEDLRQRFGAGVWFVELASLSDPGLMASAIAGAVGIELSGAAPPAEQLANRLKSRGLLLVMNNCEHLADDVARLGDSLLSQCRWLQILATSQAPVGGAAEAVLQVPPLPAPAGDPENAVEAMGSPAVVLFVTRAKSADHRFEIDDGNARVVAAICRRLDGLALAIEMAAARVSGMGVAALAQRLDERFRVLSSGQRAGLSRHQTLRATIDWSFGLLAEPERAVLRRVSAFSGGFTLEAACAVAGDEQLDEFAVADALADLCRRSLVMAEVHGDWPRYWLMESIKDYGRERLIEAGEARAIAERHFACMAALMRRCAEDAFALSDVRLRESYGPELENVRAALDWSLAVDGDHEAGLSLLGASEAFFSVLALLPEARRRFDAGLAALDDRIDPEVAASVRLGLGKAYGFSDPAQAFDALAAALPWFQSRGDSRRLGEVLIFMGRFAQVIAAHASESAGLIEQSAPLIESAGSQRLKGQLYRGRGNQAAAAGEFGLAVANLRRSYQAFREAGADGAAAAALTSLGYMLWASGDLNGGIEVCRRTLAEARADPFPDGPVLGFILGNLAGMLTERGDLAEAADLFAEAGPLLRDPWQLWVIFDHVALFQAKRGELDLAALAAGFARARYLARGAARQPNEQRAHDSVLSLLGQAMPPARTERLMADGEFLSEDEALALTLRPAAGSAPQ
jgi:predicted ATPase/class 3 adenylate cyclase